ncbi:MAG TPA: hypothetical protein VE195_09945 [Acidobacteriaceae bacterium]|nr:hypothetical protein [Acidobacteriaceae bacterium]
MTVEECLPDHNLAQGLGHGLLHCGALFSVAQWSIISVCALFLLLPRESHAQSAPPPSAPPAGKAPSTPSPAPVPPRPAEPASPQKAANPSAPTHITPEQARQLFSSVDAILRFDSKVTGLPVSQSVKRRLVTRDEVEKYLMHQLQNDRDAKRLQSSELVLKKFGLLDRDFQLKPFLIQLLREQIAGYYDDKTKTVNLLDWIPPDQQKPVLAHELTHALQDQHIHLEKWDREDERPIPKNVQQDNEHIATDEEDTVRDTVVEGQAMAAFVDYILAPTGKTLLTAPQVVDKMNEAMGDSSDSPTLANAPLVLQRSLIFPYVAGLNFVRAVWTAKGTQAAFAGMLDHPPSSTYEVMNPKAYLTQSPVPLLRMPDIHSLIDSQYQPYDIGVMGEFDVQLMAELFGGQAAADALAPAWRGGIYYTAQSRQAATASAKDSTASLALLYLSRWATPEAALAFANLYAGEIPRKYDDAVLAPADDADTPHGSIVTRIWNTSEGPVFVVVSGKTVFISESFPMDLARKLEFVMMGSIVDSATSVTVQNRMPPEDLTGALRSWLFALSAPEEKRMHDILTTLQPRSTGLVAR